jgi:hypothetical protein
MALLLPAIMESKTHGEDERIRINSKAIVAAIDGFKLRYHKWPADNGDLGQGEDVTYGTSGHDNHLVFDKLVNPPDGNPGADDALIDLSDFIVDKSGNVLKGPLPDGEQYKITLDINADHTPSGGISVN